MAENDESSQTSSVDAFEKTEAEIRFEKEHDRVLAKKLRVIEKVRSQLEEESIECPGVIVVGDQSSGKSSVLESLTGVSFPKDSGTCTRTPIVVSLETRENISGEKIIEVSDHSDGSRATTLRSMTELESHLMSKSKAVGNSIEDKPMYVRYIRKSGPVFTLTDLPGIAERDLNNPDFDIKTATTELVEKYAKKRSMIILFCHSAATDISNSKALKVIENLNRYSDRTIFVYTMVDMLREENNKSFVQNSREHMAKINMKHGFVMIRNRLSGAASTPMKDIEMEVFSNPIFNDLRENEKGFGALQKKILDLQNREINAFIPATRKQLAERIKKISKDIDVLGKAPESKKERRRILNRMLSTVQKKMGKLIEAQERDLDNPDLNVARQTRELFATFRKELMDMLKSILDIEYNKKVEDSYTNLTGHKIYDVDDHVVLNDQIKPFLRESLWKAEKLVDKVREYTLDVYREVMVTSEEHERFPTLRRRLGSTMDEILDTARKEVMAVISSIISAEMSNPTTYDPNYKRVLVGVRGFITKRRNGHSSNSGSENEEEETSGVVEISTGTIKELLSLFGIDDDFLYRWTCSETDEKEEIYFSQFRVFIYTQVVLRRLADVIPMVVKNELVFKVHESFFESVIHAYDGEEQLKKLLKESEEVEESRKDLKQRKDKLKKVLEELEDVSEPRKNTLTI